MIFYEGPNFFNSAIFKTNIFNTKKIQKSQNFVGQKKYCVKKFTVKKYKKTSVNKVVLKYKKDVLKILGLKY